MKHFIKHTCCLIICRKQINIYATFYITIFNWEFWLAAPAKLFGGRESEHGFSELLFYTGSDEQQHLLDVRSTFSKKILFPPSFPGILVLICHVCIYC